MRRALGFSPLLLGVLVISSHAHARGGGGVGFTGSLFGNFGGFSRDLIRVAPSAHAMNGFHRQSIVRRRVFAAGHLHALGLQRRQFFGQTGFLFGGGIGGLTGGQAIARL